jgi:hypothetical protein
MTALCASMERRKCLTKRRDIMEDMINNWVETKNTPTNLIDVLNVFGYLTSLISLVYDYEGSTVCTIMCVELLFHLNI